MKNFAKTSIKKKDKDTGKSMIIPANLIKRHGGIF
jgi:hypothetical protein